jgi:hypothetical protein
MKEIGEGTETSVKAITAANLTQIVLKDSYWRDAPWRFISIDIESLDEEFLNDLDIGALAPDLIAVEHFIPKNVSDWSKLTYIANSCDLVNNLKSQGFSLQSICGPTLIFVRTASNLLHKSK